MDVKVGDIVTYKVFGGELRTVEVTAISADIKNGKSGFDGIAANQECYWGYDYQITAINGLKADSL